MHIKGKFWHPVDRTGEDDTKIVLITERHDAAKFLLCHHSREPLEPTRDWVTSSDYTVKNVLSTVHQKSPYWDNSVFLGQNSV